MFVAPHWISALRHAENTSERGRARQPRRSGGFIIKTILALSLVPIGSWLLLAAETAKPKTESDAAKRGQYIVEHVAMCVHCHTPRDPSGALIRSRYLEGAPVPVAAPVTPRIEWAIRAPAIVGLPGYTVEDGIRLLTQGITPDGRTPRPPMPPFRLTRSDAEAVVAYLKSIS